MSERPSLIDVKQALSEKYARLSQGAHSKAKRRQFAYRSVRYQRQVEQLRREQ